MNAGSKSLILEDVSIGLGGQSLIDIDTRIGPGEILTVTGASGSGKSSLLAYLAGFLPAVFDARGRVYLGERDITSLPAERRRVGLLFQDAMLFPHMSVGQNLLFAIPPDHNANKSRREMADEALEEAGMGGFFDRDPATLSGGQKARTALMRVLLAKPQALLLDEPFSRLDARRRHKIREFVLDEARQRQLPVLLVTHDDGDARHAGGPVFDLD